MRRWSRVGAACCSFVLALPAVTSAATPQQIVALLNHERVTNGIPGGITLNPAWTLGCRHHLRYEELNGITWTDTETPGKPGYTKDGAFSGITGDQANTGTFDAGNPYENLPLHLANLLQPRLGQIGAADDSAGRSCVDVSLGFTRQFTANHLFTYPGPNRTDVPTSQRIHGESPHAPGDFVGLPQGTTTGPTIYVFAVGPWVAAAPVKLTSAHLTGPGGPVAVRIVDPSAHPSIKELVAPGVFFVIPVSPLAAGTVYSAAVTVRSGGTVASDDWQFRTAS